MFMGIVCILGNILIVFLVAFYTREKNQADESAQVNPDSTPAAEQTRNGNNGHHHNGNHHDPSRLMPDGEVIIMYPLASASLFHSAQQSIKRLFGVIGRGTTVAFHFA